MVLRDFPAVMLVFLLIFFCVGSTAFFVEPYGKQSKVSILMVPPLKEDIATGIEQSVPSIPTAKTKNQEDASLHQSVQVSFSHIQLYADRIGDIDEYKALEKSLNSFVVHESNNIDEKQDLWQSLNPCAVSDQTFISQNRDVIKQLLTGFGFRVTGYRFPEDGNDANTRSLLVTSKDPNGVQIVVTAIDEATDNRSDEYHHFDAENVRRFYGHHADRQGIAVLGFVVDDAKTVHERYQEMHPNLIHSYNEYEDVKVLEVFAYYNHTSSEKEGMADVGTMLRFIETNDSSGPSSFCILPGLQPVEASFDSTSQAAYCDHWVSNVFSRTEFLRTLEDTLGFTPKVDFNAGVVAAGEAQIESTVTGNDSKFRAEDKTSVLQDQSQVYLPINNALSEVGHVHGFLQEIGQGIQHVASRVDNLVDFIQRCNDMRETTGEGFTFLNIPRSYYGVLTKDDLVESTGIPEELADSILSTFQEHDVTSLDGAVNLDLSKDDIAEILDTTIRGSHKDVYDSKKDEILQSVLQSRYKNLYSLLRENVSESTYLGIVNNQILCDVQGEDILYQIFTSNILQRNAGEEAPFFEYIQRVCSECKDEDGCAVQIKPGCGGFGIRNFLTLFLSIEVSKAMLEVSETRLKGDEEASILAQKKVDCFTSQLNDSNPILTQISDAMTLEGYCKAQMESELARGCTESAVSWKAKREEANESKMDGNKKLMECSARYNEMMRKLREESLANTL